MSDLRLVGPIEGGRRLLLVGEADEEFTLVVDARLRSALGGEHPRLGQLETKMDSALRPRDIQTRIRHGESPESVAQAARTTVEQIMPFAVPVLAERAHVADRAQRSSVRRRTTDAAAGPSASRTLGDAVAVHLRSLGVDPEVVEWDAWRRDDGRWALQGDFAATRRTGSAQFTFDTPGNYVTVDNDDARWLVGALVDEDETTPSDDLGARRRRLSAVEDQLSIDDELGSDALDLVRDDQSTGRESAMPAAPGEAEEPVGHEATDTDTGTGTGTDTDTEPEGQAAADEDAGPARTSRRRGRASVPSWDEIMFGGGRSE